MQIDRELGEGACTFTFFGVSPWNVFFLSYLRQRFFDADIQLLLFFGDFDLPLARVASEDQRLFAGGVAASFFVVSYLDKRRGMVTIWVKGYHKE